MEHIEQSSACQSIGSDCTGETVTTNSVDVTGEIDTLRISSKEPSTVEHMEGESFLPIIYLPEVALVNIMEYLSLKDRYHLSMTCRRFYGLFSHPKLWQVAHIVLLPQGTSNGKNYSRWRLQSMMHQTMAEIVHRFSHLFQHLSLDLIGYMQPFGDICRQMLKDLNEECRLESLSIKLGALASNDDDLRRITARRSKFGDLPLVAGLIRKATRLKRLAIISWPLHIELGDDSDIFKAIVNNEKIQNLESLGLFYIDKEKWSERNPKLPSPETTLTLVKHLRNLSHLALRSPMLSNEVLLELSSTKRSQLSQFQVLIVYSREGGFVCGFNVPDLSSQAWTALRTSSPGIKVDYLVLTRIPYDQLSSMLKPEVPLSSMTILCYGRCDIELIYSLAEKYKATLEKFVSECDSSDCDAGLLHLVSSCTQLKHLAYHGNIHYRTVMRLADMIKERGLEYACLEFKEKNILTGNVADVEDEDVVIAKDNEKQEYYLVGLMSWHQDEDQHKRLLDIMTEHVSQALGYRWCPV